MGAAHFSMALFKDADVELQQKYPDALWFALSSKGMTGGTLEAREMALVKMRREQGIVFMRQDEEFNGQIVWVGEAAVWQIVSAVLLSTLAVVLVYGLWILVTILLMMWVFKDGM